MHNTTRYFLFQYVQRSSRANTLMLFKFINIYVLQIIFVSMFNVQCKFIKALNCVRDYTLNQSENLNNIELAQNKNKYFSFRYLF